MPPIPVVAVTAPGLSPEATEESLEYTKNLLDWEIFATVLIILSGVLVIMSASQSKFLINSRNLPPEELEELRKKIVPIRISMAALISGIIALIILTWASVARLAQRRALYQLGDKSLTIWPDVAIVLGFLISIVALGFKALGVGKRYQELATVVII